MQIKILLVLILVSQELIGQNTISATGNSLSNSNATVEYCIGQIASTTLIGSNMNVTQGLLQPNIQVTVGIHDTFDKEYMLSAFPNPTQERISITTNYPSFHTLLIQDINGKVIRSESWNRPEVDLKQLTTGIYIIRLISKDYTKSIKIIKQ
jgi:hypothetical protein